MEDLDCVPLKRLKSTVFEFFSLRSPQQVSFAKMATNIKLNLLFSPLLRQIIIHFFQILESTLCWYCNSRTRSLISILLWHSQMENEVHHYKNKMEEYKEHSRNQRDKSRRIVVACMTKLEEKESDIEKVKKIMSKYLLSNIIIYLLRKTNMNRKILNTYYLSLI